MTGKSPFTLFRLLLKQAGVTSDALPLAVFLNPGIGEAAEVIVGFALVGSPAAIDTRNNCGIPEEIDLCLLNVDARRFEERVADVGQEFAFIADIAVPLGVDESVRNQGVEGRGIAVDLGFVPQAFQRQQLGLARAGLLGSRDQGYGQQKTAAEATDHNLTRSATSPRGADAAKT